MVGWREDIFSRGSSSLFFVIISWSLAVVMIAVVEDVG